MLSGGEANQSPDVPSDDGSIQSALPDPAINGARLKEVLDLGEELPTHPAADTIEAVPFHQQVKENSDNG